MASASQGADIRKIVESVQGVTQVKEKFEIIPRPFCAVLDLLEPIKKQAEDRGIDLVTSLNKAGNIPDYYDKESSGHHGENTNTVQQLCLCRLLRCRRHGWSPLSKLRLRGRIVWSPTGRLLSANPMVPGHFLLVPNPPGLELITVIASKTPLFSGVRNDEPAESYLKELRQALSKENVKPDVTATFHFIRTKP